MSDSSVEDPAPATEAELERRQVRALDLPGLIGGVLADIRAIAEGMAVLPKLLGSLELGRCPPRGHRHGGEADAQRASTRWRATSAG